jgi:aspartate/methionine/tyrosine aminotransferase
MESVERTLIRRIFDEAPPDAINLGLGLPDLETPPVVSLAGVRGIARGRTGYTETAGNEELRTAVARRYRPFSTGPESVVVTVGSQEAMFATLLCLADAGDEVLYPDPGFPAYPVVARLVGARPVSYPLRRERGFRIDPADVASRLTSRSRVVVLCSPSNPTGAVHRGEDLRELTDLLERRGVAWVSDEVYAGFVYDGSLPSPVGWSRTGGVVVSGLSKDLSMTGWRIGWAVGPAPVIRKITAAHQYLVTCASSVSQEAALEAFTEDGEAERERYLQIFRERRALMARELSKIDGVRFDLPDGAFYFFVDVSRYGDSLELARRILARRKVVTIPGESFGSGGRGYLRLSYAASREEIRRGVGAMGAELAGPA